MSASTSPLLDMNFWDVVSEITADCTIQIFGVRGDSAGFSFDYVMDSRPARAVYPASIEDKLASALGVGGTWFENSKDAVVSGDLRSGWAISKREDEPLRFVSAPLSELSSGALLDYLSAAMTFPLPKSDEAREAVSTAIRFELERRRNLNHIRRSHAIDLDLFNSLLNGSEASA